MENIWKPFGNYLEHILKRYLEHIWKIFGNDLEYLENIWKTIWKIHGRGPWAPWARARAQNWRRSRAWSLVPAHGPRPYIFQIVSQIFPNSFLKNFQLFSKYLPNILLISFQIFSKYVSNYFQILSKVFPNIFKRLSKPLWDFAVEPQNLFGGS